MDIDAKTAMANAIRAANGYQLIDPKSVTRLPSDTVPEQYLNTSGAILEAVDGIAPTHYEVFADQPVEVDDKTAMKNILARFYSAADSTVDGLNEKAAGGDRRLADALVTERTARGARVGSWEIVKHSDTSFDVVHAGTGEPLAKGLMLYEAAFALASNLNAGRTITDEPVRKILRLEEKYVRARQKAVHFKESTIRQSKIGNTVRAAVAEDRLDEAQRNALSEREQILRLAGLR